MGRWSTCARERARGRPGGTTSIDRRSPAPTTAAERWRCSPPWRCTTCGVLGEIRNLECGMWNVECAQNSEFRIPNSKFSGDAPAVAAERVHQLHGTLDQFRRLVYFFDRLGAVGMRNDDRVMPAEAVVADFVAKLLAVFVEETDYPDFKPTTTNRAVATHEIARSSKVFTR